MKNYILKKLKEKQGQFVSGQEISEEREISRTAIWKAINKLKESGYEIESVSRKGYRLISEPDKLETAQFKFEKNWIIGSDYIYLDETTSTNDYAKKIANDHKDGTVVIAEKQTAGKGRRGRLWDSSYGEGIWMSLLLKPDMVPTDAILITQIAAVAVAEGIKNAVGHDTKIKWPNDIVINKKKVCGILAEISGEIDYLNYIVVGIGINVNQTTESFHDEVRDKATSLKIVTSEKVDRQKVLVSVLKSFNYYYDEFVKKHLLGEMLQKCEDYSATIGNRVKVISNIETIEGEAIGLTESGALIIKLDNGEEKEIIAGEVSVRGLYNYLD